VETSLRIAAIHKMAVFFLQEEEKVVYAYVPAEVQFRDQLAAGGWFVFN